MQEKLASGYVILDSGRIEPIIIEDQPGALQTGEQTIKNAQATESGKNAKVKAVSTKSAATAEPATMLASPINDQQLKFKPAEGPWSSWRDDQHSFTLARGWIGKDEPAVILLDSELRQLWHAPLPLTTNAGRMLVSVARDPVSGLATWCASQPGSTIHFFRADGQIVDHSQFEEPVTGLGLIPVGNELHLWVSHAQSLHQYRLQ